MNLPEDINTSIRYINIITGNVISGIGLIVAFGSVHVNVNLEDWTELNEHSAKGYNPHDHVHLTTMYTNIRDGSRVIGKELIQLDRADGTGIIWDDWIIGSPEDQVTAVEAVADYQNEEDNKDE